MSRQYQTEIVTHNGRKIIFCANVLWDLVNFRGFIIRRFVDKGFEVILVAPKDVDGGAAWKLIPEGVRFIPVHLDRCGTNPWNDISYHRSLYRIYKKERPDYIFHYTIKPNIYGTLAASRLGIPSTSMISGLGYAFENRGLMSAIAGSLYRFALRRAKHVFVLNRENYRFVIDEKISSTEKTIWLRGGEGVSLTRYPFLNNDSDKTTFMLVARVLADKGYYEFVEAARMVRKEYPDVKFQILGPIDELNPVHITREMIRKHEESGAIEYLGTTDDVPSIEGRPGTVVVLPSYHEGMSRSLMEALAMGKPVIASDIPGCREAVIEGQNGYLVIPKDAPSLAEACFSYLRLSPEERMKFSLASRRLAEDVFDIEHVYVAYKKVMQECFDL